MTNTTTFFALALALASTALASGCQQPVRCGALDEPCCAFEGMDPCISELGLSCSSGVCTGAARTACPATSQTCDVGLQNCNAGESCQLTDSSTACTAGTLGFGQACAGNCGAGLYCSAVTNVCERYCCEETGCPSGQACIAAVGSVGYCTNADCDPTSSTSCGASGACSFVSVQGVIRNVCLAAGTSPIGGSCGGSVGCVGGAFCGNDNVCHQICRTASPSCATGSCTAFSDLPEYGLCV